MTNVTVTQFANVHVRFMGHSRFLSAAEIKKGFFGVESAADRHGFPVPDFSSSEKTVVPASWVEPCVAGPTIQRGRVSTAPKVRGSAGHVG